MLAAELHGGRWQRFRAAVAFVKRSGARQLLTPLDTFLRRPGTAASLAVGIDHDGTSLEGLQDLWRVMSGRGDLVVFKEGQGGGLRTFHPKAYLFERPGVALALIGSGNLTAGGLYSNHELTVAATLDLTDQGSADFHAALDAAMQAWLRPGSACRPVDPQLLYDLNAAGELPSEARIAAARRAGLAANRRGSAAQAAGRPALFGSSGASAQPPAPPLASPALATLPKPSRARGGSAARAVGAAAHHTFVIEVRPHRNGEIFLSKRAVDEDPGFFGEPFGGWTTPKKRGNAPYRELTPDPHVEIVIHDARGNALVRASHDLNVVFYTPKSEYRITVPQALAAQIPQMALLAMTRNPSPAFDYRLEFHPPSSSAQRCQVLRAQLTQALPTGGAPQPRHYGWF